MRVLVTGANGQLGGALQRLAPAWAEVTAFDVEDCDLTDVPMLTARLKVEAPELILNAAAYTAVDKAESDEGVARAINVEAVAVMTEVLAGTGGKLVHVSTDYVFDGTSSAPYPPEAPRNPQSAYGRTKAEGEDRLRAEDLLVRTGWVYEAGGANFVRTMIRLMNEREELGVVADQVGAPTWATGLARTIWALVESQATGIFHHCDDGAASWHEFAVAIAEEAYALGLIPRIPAIHAITTAEYPTPAQRPAFSLLDCSKTRAFLGDRPVAWRDNLRLMLKEEAKLG
ncbi:MAG: dTDP-4-dehydrorhamnose reductase [Erythrobacter sp.]|uniref:dTDP-4-dehydrorhamnose reductase n=1 Tax=Erythrobacter sp. TaxID=1042 RepID=UPI0025CC1314|nr:dTDP-4-dehydrorhamnose reductase [Erythrobacter sp.]MCM0000442.1 dTDP-4-dehydrorhamnose reductase [Erythrobacter sp.]